MGGRDGSGFPLLKTSWNAAFRAVKESTTPSTVRQFVSKAAVNGVPPRFRKVNGNTIVPTYEESGLGGRLRIQDWGLVYVVSMQQRTQKVPSWFESADPSPSLNDALGLAPIDRSSSFGGQPREGRGLTPAQKLVGGAALLYAGYKGLQALGSAFGSQERQQTSSLPRLAQAANRLDNKEYKIFVSHSWTYDEHYERIVEFLDEVPSLDWQNHSVPSTDPLPATNDEALKRELRDQIRPASVVVVSAGMYGAYSKWISIELDLAEEFDKPVIGIVPHGQERVPAKIQESATVQVGWRQASLIDALADHG